jgi:hypothetical protein
MFSTQDFTEWRVLEVLFPNSIILICTFHVLKWIKGLIATALVIKEKRYYLNVAFRALLFARDEADFMEKLVIWEKEIEGVEVRRGAGENATYTSLAEYYEKNWAPVRHMWARFERKRLPLGEEHTTNRLERGWGVMKVDLKISNIGEVTIEKAIPQVVGWVEGKMVESFTMTQRKEMQIYDEDPVVMEVYKKAAVELNDTGCLALKKSVERMRKYQKMMAIVEGGVKETFVEGGVKETFGNKQEEDEDESDAREKIYETSEKDCNCTRWCQDGFPCRHILFLRNMIDLPLFDKTLFAEYFYKERKDDLDDMWDDSNNNLETMKEEVLSDEQENDDVFVLEPEEKYKIARDMATQWTELVCHFGTPQFREYMWEFELLKRRVRRGQSMLGSLRRKPTVMEDAGGSAAETKKDGTDEEDDNGKERFQFEKKINKRGRPKYSKAGKLQFPKPKVTITEKRGKSSTAQPKSSTTQPKSSTTQPKSSTTQPKSSTTQPKSGTAQPKSSTAQPKSGPEEIISDTEVSVDLDTSWHQVCLAPPVQGQFGDNVITMHDYASLAPGEMVTDSIVNWWLRLLDHQHRHLREQGQQPVLLLSTEFAVRLGSWDPASGLPKEQLGLHDWTEHARLWQGGARLVVLPVCWQYHYYVLVAVLDEEQPTLYILESIGGSFARAPAVTENFCSYLQLLRAQAKYQGPDFTSVVQPVPRQRAGSNNCGLFCLKFAEVILENPDGFEVRAKRGELDLWFPVKNIDSKRGDLAVHIGQLAMDQRDGPSGEMVNQLLDLPLPPPIVVLNQVIYTFKQNINNVVTCAAEGPESEEGSSQVAQEKVFQESRFQDAQK